ncbi:LysM peptidoglycan-binding domain-containing protein [Actinomadura fibrosa]
MLTTAAFAQQYKYHIVKRGETTADIARMYNITEATLFKYNPDARNGISPETKLVVPLTESVRQENVKFEIHRVKRKETLFSLSQQYGVEIEDIKRFNKHLYSQELKRGEKIRIPVNLPVVEKEATEKSVGNPLDLTIKEHVVLPKETLYGISRKYNITIADLQRLNPNLENLQPGMVLKVRNGSFEKVVDVEGDLFKYYQVKPQETLYRLTKKFGISKDSLIELNPALADGLKSGMVLRVPNVELYEEGDFSEENLVNLENRLNNFRTKNLVVMLPFNLDKVVKTDTSSNSAERIRKDKVMQISLDFYSGVLMAVDSAKSLGITTNLRFFDTEQKAEKVRSIINTNDFSNVDAVIGPLLQSTIEAAASSLERQNVPVISPLTKKQAGSMGNFLQSRPTDEMLSEAMISYISRNASGKNIIIIADAAASAKKSRLLAAFPDAKTVNPREGSYLNEAELAGALVAGRPNWVILEASKIGVLSNATSYLNSMADKFPITLMTTDRNNSFDSDNVSNRHLAKLKFHYPSVDRAFSPEKSRSFVKKYEEKYGVIPNIYVIRGFDVTYDVLLRLASAEDLYASIAQEGMTQYVENKFDYEMRPTGGYQNKAIYIMAYDKDLNLNVVE